MACRHFWILEGLASVVFAVVVRRHRSRVVMSSSCNQQVGSSNLSGSNLGLKLSNHVLSSLSASMAEGMSTVLQVPVEWTK